VPSQPRRGVIPSSGLPPASPERLTFGPARPLPSTWQIFPSEAAKQPSLVIVTNAAGQRIATIDPLTRQRRSLSGRLEATLSYQGFNAYLTGPNGHTPISIAPREPRRPDYGSRVRQDRDKRG
jgi:hypothetical protein